MAITDARRMLCEHTQNYVSVLPRLAGQDVGSFFGGRMKHCLFKMCFHYNQLMQ